MALGLLFWLLLQMLPQSPARPQGPPGIMLPSPMLANLGRTSLCDSSVSWESIDPGVAEECALETVLEHYMVDHLKKLGLDKKPPLDPEVIQARSKLSELLRSLPPKGSLDPTEVLVSAVKISGAGFQQFGFQEDAHITGLFNLTWHDRRISWVSKSEPKLELFNHVFSPKLSGLPGGRGGGMGFSPLWSPSFRGSARFPFRSTGDMGGVGQVFRDGKIVLRRHFAGSEHCQVDYSHYPYDQHHCCLSLTPSTNPELVRIKVLESSATVASGKRTPAFFISKEWDFQPGTVAANQNEAELKICVHLRRRSPMLPYVVVSPVLLPTILAMLIPVFSKWKIQIYSKFAALLFLYLYLHMSQFRMFYTSGTSVPKFMKLCDFLLWTTAISLAITVILWGMSSRDRSTVPPPHTLLLIARRVNGACCGANKSVAIGDAHELREGDVSDTPRDVSTEWEDIFLAINNVFLLFFTVVYVLGIFLYSVTG